MGRAHRVSQILAELLSPAGDGEGDGLGARLVTVGGQALQVTGVGLAWMTDRGPGGTLAATSGPAQLLEEVQYSLGAGPGVDCSRRGVPEMHPDLSLADPGRWHGYTDRALDAGIAAVFAFPLQIGGIKLGVLDLYNETPGPLASAALDEARALADAATAVMLHLQSSGDRGRLHDELADTVLDRAEVHQATGMISVQIRSNLLDALAVLRARAYSSGRGINDVAHDVVTRQLRFTDADE
jgi:hypothetical protein